MAVRNKTQTPNPHWPKATNPRSQQTNLTIHLEDLVKAGINEISIVIGNTRPEKVKEHHGKGQAFNAKINYIRQSEPKERHLAQNLTYQISASKPLHTGSAISITTLILCIIYISQKQPQAIHQKGKYTMSSTLLGDPLKSCVYANRSSITMFPSPKTV